MSGWNIVPDDPSKKQRATLYKWDVEKQLVMLLAKEDASAIIGILSSLLGDATDIQKDELEGCGFPRKIANLLTTQQAERILEICREAWEQVGGVVDDEDEDDEEDEDFAG